MSEIRKIPAGTEEDLNSYAVRPIPAEKRIGWGLQGLIWSGTMFCIPVFTVGGALAAAIGARTHLASGFNAALPWG